MTEVRRYSLHTDTTPNGGWYASMVCVIDGDYVAYSDHEALVRENERLREALRTARVELGCLFTAAELKKVRIDLCDVPPEPNDADKECIAAAFNAIRSALSPSGASR